MEYMKLAPAQQDQLLEALLGMPDYLKSSFADLNPDEITARGSDGSFSPVEQVWHLADLEREGFGERIRRLLSEAEPQLPDFDGAKAAADRHYRTLSLDEGLSAFSEARRRNVDMLRDVAPDAWLRVGMQEGVGNVSLCDMPSFMCQHDAAHRREIEAWRADHASS
jgi:DinB family protein